MEMAEIVAFAQRFWVVWLLALFAGILVWVLWPGRKQEMDRFARIPLEDDPPADDGAAVSQRGGENDRQGGSGGKGD